MRVCEWWGEDAAFDGVVVAGEGAFRFAGRGVP